MLKSEVIQPAAMQTPFAINGNKNIPSQTASGTDTSSIDLGFLPITQEALDDGGQAPERTDFNGIFYLSTDLRVFLQNGGFITFDPLVSTAIGGYPQDAVLGYINQSGQLGFVRSLKDNNNLNFIQNPNYIDGVNWEFSYILNIQNAIDTVNSRITSVQSGLQSQITTNKNNITVNTNSINTLNSQVVKLSGNQTISGTKTFSGVIKVPNSTTNGTAIAQQGINKANNGYLKLGNGIIYQWGVKTGMKKDTNYVISLPTNFSSNDSYRVIPAMNTNQDIDDTLNIHSQRTSNFSVYVTQRGGNDSDWTVSGNWIAIGY